MTKDTVITDIGIFNKSEFNAEWINSDRSVYEVIRVIDGIALFLENHFERLISSARIRRLKFEIEFPEFRRKINELVKLNQKQSGNVKFVLFMSENKSQWIFTFIPQNYPDQEDYLYGVSTDLLFAERKNPNAKVIQNTIREKADQMIADQKLFEVLLVNSDGLITEGSRSNVFFVKGEEFFTAPISLILVGITRQKVIYCLNELSCRVIEEAVRADEISRFDAVFLTGTSPKVLPVKSIGNQIYSTENVAVKQLTECYNDLIDRYIQNEITNGIM